MKEVNDLHRQAMALVDLADEAKRSGHLDRHLALSKEAFDLEVAAAWMLAGEVSLEPSRSVLFRSAATLAMDVGQTREAERLIAAALAGNPPPEIAEELRDLLEDVYFHRHLKVRGITLAPGDLQMTLEGNAVGFGIARSEAFIQRVKDLETLLYRTAERRLGRTFREAGRREKDLAQGLELYLSVPRAASFAVTLRLGKSDQLELPGLDFSSETLKDVLDGITMITEGKLTDLENAIPDGSYRANFIGLIERLSPDGQDIKVVGFTSVSDQTEHIVALSTPKKELRERMRRSSPKPQREVEVERITIKGMLLEADARRQREGIIEVVDADGTAHRIAVPRGMMSDIVKPMFEEEVLVVGVRLDGKISLETIDLLVDEERAD